MNLKTNFLYFFLGIIVTLLVFSSLKRCFSFSEEKTQNDYFILKNQITKMNKMVVLEQDFSTLQKNKVSYEILGNKISEKEVTAFVKTNAQVSYDLNQMKIEVDSINKKIIIKELPKAEIRIVPNVEIQSMDDSFFNRIDEDQIKQLTKTAKENAIKLVDQKKLQKEGRKQLEENLSHIFVLAKALHYQIVDQTGTIDPSSL